MEHHSDTGIHLASDCVSTERDLYLVSKPRNCAGIRTQLAQPFPGLIGQHTSNSITRLITEIAQHQCVANNSVLSTQIRFVQNYICICCGPEIYFYHYYI